jgi:hypothetical protein
VVIFTPLLSPTLFQYVFPSLVSTILYLSYAFLSFFLSCINPSTVAISPCQPSGAWLSPANNVLFGGGNVMPRACLMPTILQELNEK